MNTGFLGPAVATVLTACGIETRTYHHRLSNPLTRKLQQYLPLAVLKPSAIQNIFLTQLYVATVLTACGIETLLDNVLMRLGY